MTKIENMAVDHKTQEWRINTSYIDHTHFDEFNFDLVRVSNLSTNSVQCSGLLMMSFLRVVMMILIL